MSYGDKPSRLARVEICVRILALFALIALCVIIAYYVLRTAPRIEQTVEDLDRSTIIAGAMATNLEKASRTWETSSKQQASDTTEAMQRTSEAMSSVSAAAKQLSSFISRTDDSVNSALLPALTKTITDQNAQLGETQSKLQASLVQIAAATASTQQMIADADAEVKNPDIAATFKNVATTTSEAAGTMTSVHKAVDYEVSELMKPISKVKAVALAVIKALGIFFGY